MKYHRLVSMLCAVCVGAVLSIPVFAADAMERRTSELEQAWTAPPGEVHCQSGDETGVVLAAGPVKKIVGYEIDNCTHGAVGRTDIKYQYQEFVEFSCTLCSDSATIGGTPYWGQRSCKS